MEIEKYYLIKRDGRYLWAPITRYSDKWVSPDEASQWKSKAVASFLAKLKKAIVIEVIK